MNNQYKLEKNLIKVDQDASPGGGIEQPTNDTNPGDILVLTDTPGVYESFTPNSGAVKFLNVLENVTLASNAVEPTKLTVDLSRNTQIFSNIVDFPKTVSNPLKPDTPDTAPQLFSDLIFNNNRWLENPVLNQVHEWRLSLDITKETANSNRDLTCRIVNPDSGFILAQSFVLQGGPTTRQNQKVVFEFKTVADINSIGSGYIIELEVPAKANNTIIINSLNLLRVSLNKI